MFTIRKKIGPTVRKTKVASGGKYFWIRRGYGAFVRMPSEVKARQRAKQWHEQGGGGSLHPVIGLFIGSENKYPWQATREELYNGIFTPATPGTAIPSECEAGLDA